MRVVGLCAYFQNSLIDNLVAELQRGEVELHLWALERSPIGLSPLTRGHGLHPKWPIMTHLMQSVRPDFDYVMFFDDDIVLPRDFVRTYLDAVQSCGGELSQPALTPDSHHSHPITLRDPSCWARHTNFVEIGPLVCMTRRFYELASPYHDPISPLGWGYEAQWSHVGRAHNLPLAIIDRCAVRHTRPIGVNYDRLPTIQQMQLYLEKYGNPMPIKTVLKRFPNPQ